jgi:drug/metabolite transporter (DMT)-like permease
MTGLIFAAVITLVSLITNYFVPDRFQWRKIALLIIEILGIIWTFSQGYKGR